MASIPLHLCKDYAIGVQLYACLMEAKIPSAKWIEAASNEPIKVETQYLCEKTGR